MFPGYLGHSILGVGLKNEVWSLKTYNIRDFAEDRHKTVDGTPAGGGAGMVLKPNILDKTIRKCLDEAPKGPSFPLIYLSPRGKLFDQKMALKFSKGKGITLICGRFEGIDERVLKNHDIEEVSLGDFILTGGEIAAQALIDSTVRLIPQIVGNKESILEDSFSNGLLEYPQYTKPAIWAGKKIPRTLLSGHHQKIKQWRIRKAKKITKKRRPDLWKMFKKNNSLLTGDNE
jgi:tRNA (guanine37-N1)-methyltransferase